MQFRVPQLRDFDPLVWNTAYIAGIEGIPWAGRVSVGEDSFSIERAIDESGKLSVIWPNREYGASVLATASLKCRDEPYCLPLELARGTLHRVRQRAFDWQRQGMKIPESYNQAIDAAVNHFIEAILSQSQAPQVACRQAQAAIEMALTASRPLCRAWVTQVLQYRLQQERQLNTLLGIRLDSTDGWQADATVVRKAMNTAVIQPSWHLVQADTEGVSLEFFEEQIRWCKEHNLRIVSGPLVSLQAHAIQQWMHLLGDFEALYQAACQYVRRVVERFRGQVQIWNVASGLNSPNALGLTDEQVLQLAVGIIQTARRSDAKTPITITIDMPWAEYLGQADNAISPFHFADALLRAELGVSGIALDMNFNYWPGGTLPRDLIDVSDLIDQWSLLGIPLVVSLTAPHQLTSDPKAYARYSVVGSWRFPSLATNDRTESSPDVASYVLEVFQMLLAKHNVQGIFWNQLADRVRHPYPHAGLIDMLGQPRPLLEGLYQLRTRYGQ
jgi:hypothetical protein